MRWWYLKVTVTELKAYIAKEAKLHFILESIGCGHIKYHPNKNYYTCSNIDGDNQTAITVKNNEYLNVVNYTRKKDFDNTADLFTLIQFNNKQTFRQAFKWVHKLLGLKFTYEKKVAAQEKIDPLRIFKKVKLRKMRCNAFDFSTLEESALYDFVPCVHISFYKEGIMPWTISKFGLGYSYRFKRTIIPLRYWLTGQLLGVNARTSVENYELLDIEKYFITPNYPKSINLFGLWENYDSIQKAGYVVVYESEKSTLKRHSLGDCTGVALSGHTMSDEQVKILIGLNVDIVICMDNDVPLEEIKYMCSKFKGIRNVYYMKDKHNLLGAKDSAADAKNKIFEYLLKYKIRF